MNLFLPLNKWLFLLLRLSFMLLPIACSGAADTPVNTKGIGNYGLVSLEIHINQPMLKAGDTLKIKFVVHNGEKVTRVFESTNQPVLDITIDKSPGRLPMAWSQLNPDKVQHHLELKPGETVTLELNWKVPLDDEALRGSWSVVGSIHDDNIRSANVYAGLLICIRSCFR